MSDVCWGVDVSSFQGSIDWDAVRSAGYAFAIVKATEGIDQDSERLAYYADNIRAAKEAGLLTGAYHFFRANQDSTTQAAVFAAAIRAAGIALDLPPALDVETTDNTEKDMITLRVERAITALTDWFGTKPLLYSYADFLDNNVDLTQLPPCSRWIASYPDPGVTSPQVPPYSPILPNGWSTYSLWQFSASGRVPGIAGDVDLNLIHGSRDALLALGSGMQSKAWTGYTG